MAEPYDGMPYYCIVCGLGLAEVMACEEPDCRLESMETAQARACRRRSRETAAQPKEYE